MMAPLSQIVRWRPCLKLITAVTRGRHATEQPITADPLYASLFVVTSALCRRPSIELHEEVRRGGSLELKRIALRMSLSDRELPV
ncbi:hypothetical protein LDDCCGHA_5360 [Methylobacterium oxalidis]|nr:hypothetical protein LDDCCGHA_5360 [Methylobacterium oxalidis]